MSSTNTSTKRQWIAEQARKPRVGVHDAAPAHRPRDAGGVDGVTATDYEKDLEANLLDLLGRIKSGSYFAPPVQRHNIAGRGGSV